MLKKRFAVQSNGEVYIRDSAGHEIAFRSVEEFNRYTGENFETAMVINYEPEHGMYGLHTVWDGTMTVRQAVPFAEYERYIANIATYQMAMDDPYWGVSEAEARTRAYQRKAAEIIAERNRRNNEEAIIYNGIAYVNDRQTIEGVMSRIRTMSSDDPIPTFRKDPTKIGTWAAADSVTFTPFTCAEFETGLAAFYYDYREENFTNYTMLTEALTALYMGKPEQGIAPATIDDLVAFDISGGWADNHN